MTHRFFDQVVETSTVTGNGPATVTGALTGFTSFAGAGVSDGDSINYGIVAVDAAGNRLGDNELGVGTWNGTNNSINRVTVIASSNGGVGGNKVVFSAGTKYVSLVALASRTLQLDVNLVCPMPVIVAEPGTPPANFGFVYFKNIAGIGKARTKNDIGLDHTLQREIAVNRWETCFGGIAAPTVVGGATAALTVANFAVSAALANTSIAASLLHSVMSTTATANAVSSYVSAPLRIQRGLSAGIGGFEYSVRFSLTTSPASMRTFHGILDTVTPLVAAIDPVTSNASGRIGIGFNVGNTGNWKMISCANGANPAVVDLGSTMPINTTDAMELLITSAPNGATVGYRVRNLTTGNEVTGNFSANLPAQGVLMAPFGYHTPAATAAITSQKFYKFTLEADN